jgi:hypothetical protein
VFGYEHRLLFYFRNGGFRQLPCSFGKAVHDALAVKSPGNVPGHGLRPGLTFGATEN